MLNLTHVAIGAVVGTEVASPVWAFFAGLLSHLIIDKVPHFWPKDKETKGKIMVSDGIVTALFIVALAFFKPTLSVFMGVLGAVIVDIFLVLIVPIHDSKLGKWHTNRQIHKQNLWYYSTDFLITVTFLVYLVWNWK